MCHKATVRLAGLALGWALAAAAQTTDWRQIGTSAAELQGLAGPATGPMAEVWYAEDGFLYARTLSGKIFRTQDFEAWRPVTVPPVPPPVFHRQPVRTPSDGSTTFVALNQNSQEMWGLGRQLFHSTDGGRAWETLTARQSESVVGGGIRSVTVSPRDTEQIVVASDSGIWRSMDGGLTWSGLNLYLPNLSVQKILATPGAGRGVRIQTDKLGVLELPPGAAVWQQDRAVGFDATEELAKRIAYGALVRADVTVFNGFDNVVYTGTANGLIFRSVDGGKTFPQRFQVGNPTQSVERIFVDSGAPQLVLAALGGEGQHIIRSVSAGNTWQDLSMNLPKVPARGLAADRTSGAVYAATDAGVFYAHADLEAAGPAESWNDISPVPMTRAVDVRLDPTGVQLYAAMEGYGVFAAPAPHRAKLVRLVNAADYTDRPAAPGSLVSVMGQRVNEVRNGSAQYPVWNIQGTESQIQVPFSATGPTIALAVTTAAGQTLSRDLRVLPVSPAIFVGRDGTPALFDADSLMALESGNVAHAGQRIQILSTGLGKVTPDWQTGMPALAENTPRVVAQMHAFLNHAGMPVTRATLAPGYIGTYLVEVQIPVVSNYGPLDLYITADGQESNHVQVVIVP